MAETLTEKPEKRGRGRPKKNPDAPKPEKKPKPRTSTKPKKELTEEHKKALVEGRRASFEKKRAQGFPTRGRGAVARVKGIKPEIIITGKEKDAFDFVPLIRGAFRSNHDYLSSPKIVARICRKNVWQDVKAVKEILDEYVVIKKQKK